MGYSVRDTKKHVGSKMSARDALKLAVKVAKKQRSLATVYADGQRPPSRPLAVCMQEERRFVKNKSGKQSRVGCRLTPAFKTLLKKTGGLQRCRSDEHRVTALS